MEIKRKSIVRSGQGEFKVEISDRRLGWGRSARSGRQRRGGER